MKTGAAPLSRPCGGGSVTNSEIQHHRRGTMEVDSVAGITDRRKKWVHVQANQSGEGAVSRRSRAYQASFMGIRTEKAQGRAVP